MDCNVIFRGYVINASCELIPKIRISPFSIRQMYFAYPELKEREAGELREYLKKNFNSYAFLPKGRTAISVALDHYDLKKDDVVTILTTSGNFYISSCVTKEIEKKCKWSREVTDSTKVIFINHEFGYAYTEIEKIRKYNLPVIEDCAHTFFTKSPYIGEVGDFVIYSLPKAFPMQLGAILSSRKFDLGKVKVSWELGNYIERRLFSHIKRSEEIKQKRLVNYKLLAERLSFLGISPFFDYKLGTIPGVFLFRWLENIDYPSLKIYMQINGIECSVFYGQNAFFIPIHDFIQENDIDYMCALLEFFYNQTINK